MDSEDNTDSTDVDEENDGSSEDNSATCSVEEDSGDGMDNKTRLFEALQQYELGSGDFACGGDAPDLPYPGLYIDGIGLVSLPLLKEQVEKIIAVAIKAPYGLGEKTLLNEAVRKSWQLEPTQIKLKNNKLIEAVHSLVGDVKKALGCDKKAVKSVLYKVLLYEAGGHFKAHRDTEKENGMFATLIVQLPSVFEGGKLIVRHAGKEKFIQMDGEQAALTCKYAAHYADCEHELTEIRNGYRLALVYSLCWNAMGEAPSASACLPAAQALSRALADFSNERNGEKFAWFLSHQYTDTALRRGGIKVLKGEDAAVADALIAANSLFSEHEKFELHVTQVSRQIDQQGDLDYWYGFEAAWEEESIDFEKEWYKFDSSVQHMNNVRFKVDKDVINYVCPIGMSEEDYKEEFWGEPDSEDKAGPTGNAGATRSLWYKPYAIFAWPKKDSVNVLCQSGISSAVDHVVSEVKLIKHLDKSDPNYKKAVTSVKQVVEFAATGKVDVTEELYMSERVILPLVGILSHIADVELAQSFISDVIGRELTPRSCRANDKTALVYGLGDDQMIPKLACLITAVGWKSVCSSLTALFEKCPVSQFKRWISLVDLLLSRSDMEEEELVQFSIKIMDHLYSILGTAKWREVKISEQMKTLAELIHLQIKHPEFNDSLKKFIKHTVIGNDMALLSDIITNLKDHCENDLRDHDCFKSLVRYFMEEMEDHAKRGKLNYTAAIQSVVKMAELLFLFGDACFLQRYTNAVLQSSSGELLRGVLENLASAAQENDPQWQLLVNARIQQLEVLRKRGPPPFSWHQENAQVDGHPRVQNFLRGPLETFTYQDFSGIRHARNWASKHFGGGWADSGRLVVHTALQCKLGVQVVGRMQLSGRRENSMIRG